MGARKEPQALPDLADLGARVVSVYGPFGSRTMVTMTTELANRLFPQGLEASGRSDTVDAVERALEKIRERDPDLADGPYAASARAMAGEVDHPFNSATSKSMCTGKMHDALDRLRELCPPVQEADALDRIKSGLTPDTDREPAA